MLAEPVDGVVGSLDAFFEVVFFDLPRLIESVRITLKPLNVLSYLIQSLVWFFQHHNKRIGNVLVGLFEIDYRHIES